MTIYTSQIQPIVTCLVGAIIVKWSKKLRYIEMRCKISYCRENAMVTDSGAACEMIVNEVPM